MLLYSTESVNLFFDKFFAENCPSGYKFLVDPYSTVPQSVIGSPGRSN